MNTTRLSTPLANPLSTQLVAGPWQTRAWPMGTTIAASLVVGSLTCGCEVYDESLLIQGTSTEVADDESAVGGANDETTGDANPGDESTSSAASSSGVSSAATYSTSQPVAAGGDGAPSAAPNATDEPVADDDPSGASGEESEGFDESAEPTDTETSSDDSVSGETTEAGAPTADGMQRTDNSAPGETEPTPEPPEEDESPTDAGVTAVADAGAPPASPAAEAGTDPAPMGSAVWSFDADITGWVIGVSDPTTLRGQSSLAFSATEGSPGPGSLSLDAPFTSGGQRLAVQARIASTDMRGRTVTAMVLLDSGLSQDAANPSSVKLFAKSGSAYVFASGAPTNLLPSAGWVTIEFDIDQPDYTDPSATFDAADVREIGFELIAGATSSSLDDATMYFDEVDY